MLFLCCARCARLGRCCAPLTAAGCLLASLAWLLYATTSARVVMAALAALAWGGTPYRSPPRGACSLRSRGCSAQPPSPRPFRRLPAVASAEYRCGVGVWSGLGRGGVVRVLLGCCWGAAGVLDGGRGGAAPPTKAPHPPKKAPHPHQKSPLQPPKPPRHAKTAQGAGGYIGVRL